MMDQTAQGAYGFTSWTPAVPGGVSIIPETQVGNTGAPGAVLDKLPFGKDNPLFWLLLIFLIFTGWLYASGSFGVKKLVAVSGKVGR